MAEFTAAVENYDRFMGRYATGLAPKFADAAGVRAGMRVLDVGCGPGALSVELAGLVGDGNIAAGASASGAFYGSLDDAGKATLRDAVRGSLPEGPFTLSARAWLALGTVPG